MQRALSSRLSDFKTRLEAWCADALRAYIARLRVGNGPRFPKEFNDPVWGTLVLFPLEVALLDSPLFQRLRRIKQLGVAHWVYPGTTHTRLDHSIGVVHQLQELCDSINSSGETPLLPRETVRLLRVIALCHDIGHGLMSHVSEKALENFPDGEGVALDFADFLGVERRKLSEVAAYFITGSPAFQELLRAAGVATGCPLSADSWKSIQLAVVGLPIDDRVPLLQELISGPFDADKLDYMTRDAHMAGVPVVTDIARLVRKVRAIEVAVADLPEEIAKTVRAGHPYYLVIGVALSGARTIDELMLGRTLLFDKIYRHQKVRSAEAIVAGIVKAIADLLPCGPLMLPFHLFDEDLLSLDYARIEALARRTLSEEEQQRARLIEDLSRRLRDRELLVRAFAFSQVMPLDPYRHDPQQRSGLAQFDSIAKDPFKRGEFVEAVVAEVTRILAALNENAVLKNFLGTDLKPYIWVDPPQMVPEGREIPRAYLITEDRKLVRFRDESAGTRGWADAYLLTKDTGYVFAPEQLAPYVFLACEKVVRERHGVRFPASMLQYAKQDPEGINEKRRRLDAAGYYSTSPYDLRPLPSRLDRADIGSKINSLALRFAEFSPYDAIESNLGKREFDQQRIVDWLRQFEDDDLIEAGLAVLGAIRIVGRADATRALRSFLDANADFRGAYVCPFGSPKDSSAISTYYAMDIAKEHGLKVLNLQDCDDPGRPVIFLDDLIGSGGQAQSVLQSWFGEPPTLELFEDRGGPLSEDLQANLRTRRIGFVFSAGWSKGGELLLECSKKIGLNACLHIETRDGALPSAFGRGVIANEILEGRFRAKCEEVGAELMKGSERADREAERVLGYGNQALLVAFPYNVPSQTLTCLWKSGTYRGRPWLALLPRRKKT